MHFPFMVCTWKVRTSNSKTNSNQIRFFKTIIPWYLRWPSPIKGQHCQIFDSPFLRWRSRWTDGWTKRLPCSYALKPSYCLTNYHHATFELQVADATDFHKVKAAKAAELDPFLHAGKSMWRRGVVGDWRRHFTPEMSAKVDAKMEMEWQGTPLLDYFYFGEDDPAE